MKINEQKIVKALSSIFRGKKIKVLRIEYYRYTDKECEITIHVNSDKANARS